MSILEDLDNRARQLAEVEDRENEANSRSELAQAAQMVTDAAISRIIAEFGIEKNFLEEYQAFLRRFKTALQKMHHIHPQALLEDFPNQELIPHLTLRDGYPNLEYTLRDELNQLVKITFGENYHEVAVAREGHTGVTVGTKVEFGRCTEYSRITRRIVTEPYLVTSQLDTFSLVNRSALDSGLWVRQTPESTWQMEHQQRVYLPPAEARQIFDAGVIDARTALLTARRLYR